MIKINRHNYESFFLDYKEGNLSNDEIEQLFIFLEKHPDLKKELDEFELMSIQPTGVLQFSSKDSLKKEKQSTTLVADKEDLFIAHLEGDLNLDQKKNLDSFLKENPNELSNFLTYQKLKLASDSTIQFKNKELLKRKEAKLVLLYRSLAVAASLLLLFSIGNFFKKGGRADLPNPIETAKVERSFPKTDVFKGYSEYSYPMIEMQEDEFNPKNEMVGKHLAVESKATIAKKDSISSPQEVQFLADEGTKDSIVDDQVTQKVELAKQEDVHIAIQDTSKPVLVESKNGNNSIASVKENHSTTIQEFVMGKIKQRLSGSEDSKKVEEELTMGDAVSSKVSELLGAELDIKRDKKREALAFAFKLGKFELSRTTAKK